MKKRKIKLLASLTSLVLVVAVMAVGVWAASSATVKITGNVSYNAKGNVSATIAVTDIDGSSQSDQPDKSVTIAPTATTSDNTESISLGDSLTVEQVEGSGTAATWSYTFTIKNNYAEAAENTTLYAKVTLPSAGDNYSISATVKIPSVESGVAKSYTSGTEIILAENATATFVITLTVTDVAVSIDDADVGSTIALSVVSSN